MMPSWSALSDTLDEPLLAVTCGCGRTLTAACSRGLTEQLATHWRNRHRERIVITPDEFVMRRAYEAWEVH
jgi:hypothetical protein